MGESQASSIRLAAVFVAGALSLPGIANAEDSGQATDYRPGLGWQLPGTQLRLGGYANAILEPATGSGSGLALDDLSLFLHWEGAGKFRMFSEISLERPLVFRPGEGLSSRHTYVALERLHFDCLYSDQINLRAGKFLTPIGRWNSVHAGPLVWTTSRPLITEKSFPTNATGVMVFGSWTVLGKSADYSAYGTVGEEWRPDPKLDPFERAYGLHVNLSVSGSADFGLSYANFEQRSSSSETQHLLGVDYLWSRNRYEFEAEAVYRSSEDGSDLDEKGVSLQGVAPLSDRLYGVVRYEFYDPAGSTPPLNLGLLGLTFKATSASAFKVEWRQASHSRELVVGGLMASVSALF